MIVIDPGHGGLHDRGCSLKHCDEAAYNLHAARLLQYQLQYISEQPVTLTRDSDRYVSHIDRALVAYDVGCSLYVSLHVNSGGPNAQGQMLFVEESCSDSRDLAKCITDYAPPELLRKKAVYKIPTSIGGQTAWLSRPKNVLAAAPGPKVLIEMFHASDPADLAYGETSTAEIVARISMGIDSWLEQKSSS